MRRPGYAGRRLPGTAPWCAWRLQPLVAEGVVERGGEADGEERHDEQLGCDDAHAAAHRQRAPVGPGAQRVAEEQQVDGHRRVAQRSDALGEPAEHGAVSGAVARPRQSPAEGAPAQQAEQHAHHRRHLPGAGEGWRRVEGARRGGARCALAGRRTIAQHSIA
jgi:hypothetical protein